MIKAKSKLEFQELGLDGTATFAANGVASIHGLIDSIGVQHLREWAEIAIENPDPAAGRTSKKHLRCRK